MPTHQLLNHLCLEAGTKVLQEPPESLLSCSDVPLAVFGMVKVPYEDKCQSRWGFFQLLAQGHPAQCLPSEPISSQLPHLQFMFTSSCLNILHYLQICFLFGIKTREWQSALVYPSYYWHSGASQLHLQGSYLTYPSSTWRIKLEKAASKKIGKIFRKESQMEMFLGHWYCGVSLTPLKFFPHCEISTFLDLPLCSQKRALECLYFPLLWEIVQIKCCWAQTPRELAKCAQSTSYINEDYG